MAAVKRIKLGSQGFEVSAQGLGCMSMSAFYGSPKPEPEMIALIHHAVDSSITFLDTSNVYGPHTNEILLRKALKGIRDRVQLATKFGAYFEGGKMHICGDPTYVRAACEGSLKLLDVECIDLYYQHKIDTLVPIEVTLEWSLWSRDVEEEIILTCRELGIGIVSYSPLGRGFFSVGPKLVENSLSDDARKHLPRFQTENLEHNKKLFDRVNDIAQRKGCTSSQLALSWVHHLGDDVCPIPGTTKIDNLKQNIAALSVKLTSEEMAELESIAAFDNVKGESVVCRLLLWESPLLTLYNLPAFLLLFTSITAPSPLCDCEVVRIQKKKKKKKKKQTKDRGGGRVMAAVKTIKLGSQGFEVSAQGLGCMSMSAFYGSPKPEPDMIALIHHAVNSGITFLDTSDIYGPHTNEILLGKALKGIRDRVQLATKFGVYFEGGKGNIRGDPAYVRAACEGSLKRLDVDCIDLYYQHRIDTRVPIEVTIGELKKLVEEGKVKYIGLSEASASTIRRAHAVHPITAVQLEWSLWSRDVEEEIIPTCRELGIGIVSYSPLGRGFFSVGPKLVENLSNDDARKNLPRFQPENLEYNTKIFDRVNEIAQRKGCTPSQLALAWVHHQGDDVCPIPGTTKLENLRQNIGALSVKLTLEEMAELQSIATSEKVKGERYTPDVPTWKDSETPPLSSWKAA
ncbi:hypothetical protein CDL15_Pgr013145 [Punica granatum]|uniref:NADP-dependent oxidoreductase domain-containing protein n=3 Tax=Punica granatum TaxID=22663 RepID=A0A218WDL1_PUNGR|nr:hypothetical protein CDL15_Pgr013145 [Punica granatum]